MFTPCSPLDAFCHHIATARELNTLIRRHLDDHMEVGPDEVNWANVGDANRIHNALREIAILPIHDVVRNSDRENGVA